VVEGYISLLKPSELGLAGPQAKKVVQFLLEIPKELLSRSQREVVMMSLSPHILRTPDVMQFIGSDYWRQIVSLMVKLMGMPTFYEVRPFYDMLLRLTNNDNRK
jgi:nucleolar pre-ribosomal-associated protein 2